MRSLILCEGLDDVLIIGYFLHKTSGWNYTPQGRFSELYDLPDLDKNGKTTELYTKGNEVLGIWGVGGKDSFDEAYEFVSDINDLYPDERIEKLFLLMDRDKNEIEPCLDKLKIQLSEYGIEVDNLKNCDKTNCVFEVDDEKYVMDVIPIIIPFDKTGALETVLMDGIAGYGEEERYIVNCAEKYVENIIASGKITKYLKHERDILKAKLSAAISITNPDRSTNLFNKVLLSWNWEETDVAMRHFGKIVYFLNN